MHNHILALLYIFLLSVYGNLSYVSLRSFIKEIEMDGFQSAYPPDTATRQPYRSLAPCQVNATEAQIATSSAMMKTVFALRHQSYVSQDFIDPRPDGLFSDEFDGRPNCTSILIFRNGAPVASVRASLYDPSGSISGADTIPALEAFGPEIDRLAWSYHADGRPARLLEVTRLVRHPDLANDNDLIFALYRMTGYLILHFKADMVLSAVRQNHMPFYRRLGFQKVTEPRIYPKLKFLAGLMACFGKEYGTAQRIFNCVSHHDDACASFMSGERIKVFSEMRNAGLAPASEYLF